MVRDITERKRVEGRLREYEKAVEGVEEMIAVVDRNYRLLLANRAYAQFRNIERDQLLGRLLPEVIDKEFFERVVKEKLDECFRGKIVKYELRHNYPGIGQKDLLVSYFPIQGTSGVDRAVCVLRDITDHKRSEEEFKRLTGQLLLSQDEERRRIARDLHDATGQDLVALATMLGRLRAFLPSHDRKSRKLLSDCKTLANECVREVRTLSYVLYPPVLDQDGLEDAIRDYALGFAIRSGIQVELELSPRLGRLSREVELALFRVVQESLTNIQRHSGSQQARIRIQCDSDLTMEISDDGRQASACVPRENEESRFKFGVGIPSMRERVNLIGGRLDIDTTKVGTTIRVRIPLQGSAREKTSHSGS
jgi:PAS domain S-box-containing protein